MDMLKKLAKQEIKFAHGLALLIVFSLIVSTIVAVRAQAWLYVWTIAHMNKSFGGKITYISYNCTPNHSGSCPQCPMCEIYTCSPSMWEIDFVPAKGSLSNHICPNTNFRISGMCEVGGNILGEYYLTPRFPVQIGCDDWDPITGSY